MNPLLIYPMFAMVMLTFLVGLNLFASRVSAFRKGRVTFRYFKNMDGEQPTEWMIKSSRHFSNLFEVPVLFYAGCITAMVLPVTSAWILVWAWAFVGARVLHAIIHLGPNHPRLRMMSFLLGFLCAIAIWIEVVISLH